MIRERFESAVSSLRDRLRPGESFTAWLEAETSDFVRFNHARVRQAGSVEQTRLSVDLIDGRRHAQGSIELSGVAGEDRTRLARLADDLRERREGLPEDPWLLLPDEIRSTEDIRSGSLPHPGAAVETIAGLAEGTDFVGLLASGAIHAGFADSRGQRNWHTVETFHLDASIFVEADRAAKLRYSGSRWDAEELARRIAAAKREAETMRRPPAPLSPGEVRVWLGPAAVQEILGVLSWGGFGLRGRRTKATPLLRMVEKDFRLHRSVHLTENVADGLAPRFQEAGFLRPPSLSLIRDGAIADCLVSPASSAEYGVPCNGAPANEMPVALELAAGELVTEDVLRRLGDGLWIGELHYLNFSDRPAGRITGLTRFGTFHVRGGEIAAPAPVMRFDDTVYRILGERLEALGAERRRFLEVDTYERRSMAGSLVPGALVDGFRLAL